MCVVARPQPCWDHRGVWDGSHGCSGAMEGYRLCRSDRLGSRA